MTASSGIGHFRNQYFAVFVVAIIAFSNGLLIVWFTPILPLLKSDDTPLASGPLSLQDVSWMGSIVSIGAMIGALVVRPLTDRVGCKRMMELLPIPITIAWLLVIFASSPGPLLVSRFLCGFMGSNIDSGSVLFVAEISDDRIRGALSSVSMLARGVGYTISFTVGAYVEYAIVPYLYIGLPILFLGIFWFLPNTAPFLIRRGKLEEAKKSIKYYRGYTDDNPESINALNLEYERLLVQSKQQTSHASVDCQKVCRPIVYKALLFAFILTFLNQYCGCYTLILYSVVVFQRSGTNIDAHVSTIIMGVLHVLGLFGSTSLVEIIGRKKLLLISVAGSALGLSTMSSYMYLDSLGFNMSSFNWIPVISIGFVVLISSVGIVSLVYVCIVEMLPTETRGFGITTSILFLYLFAFISSNTFPVLIESLELHGSIAIYAVACAIGTLFIAVFIGETKGKNLDSIGNENDISTHDEKL